MANRNGKNQPEMSFAEMREILASSVKQGQAHENRLDKLDALMEKRGKAHENRLDKLDALMEKNARQSAERFSRLEAQIEKNEQRAKKRDELLDRKLRALQETVNFISEQTIALQDMQEQNELRFMEFDKFLIRIEDAMTRQAADQAELTRKLNTLIDLDRKRRSNGRNGKKR
jgi:hypothetical protein